MHDTFWQANIIVGHGLTLQHLRYNSECDVYEELEPIDRNLQYDFNYQQINHLTREVTVLPVSIGSVLIEDTFDMILNSFRVISFSWNASMALKVLMVLLL